MPIVQEKLSDIWNVSNWKETIGESRPSGSSAFSLHSQEDCIPIEVPYNQLRSCLSQLFGYSECVGTELKRTLPIQHPIFPWLWADAAQSTPMYPLGNKDYTKENPITHTSYPTPKQENPFLTQFQASSPETTTRYGHAHVNVRFKQVNGRMYADNNPTWNALGRREVDRFVGMESCQPNIDLITAQGGDDTNTFYFADTSTLHDSRFTIGAQGTKFPGTIYVRKLTTNYVLTWSNVEENFLIDTSDSTNPLSDNLNYWLMPYPPNIMKYLGYLNSTKFAGHAPGTLLFNGVQAIRYQQPVLSNIDGWGLWAWDIKMMFQQFDPQTPKRPGADGNFLTDPPNQTPARGHLLFPSRNGGWYYATKGNPKPGDPGQRGSYNGTPILESKDFNKIFSHWSAS